MYNLKKSIFIYKLNLQLVILQVLLLMNLHAFFQISTYLHLTYTFQNPFDITFFNFSFMCLLKVIFN